jgi:hypothetical protein
MTRRFNKIQALVVQVEQLLVEIKHATTPPRPRKKRSKRNNAK